MNFTFTITTASAWGVLIDGSWNGIIGIIYYKHGYMFLMTGIVILNKLSINW